MSYELFRYDGVLPYWDIYAAPLFIISKIAYK